MNVYRYFLVTLIVSSCIFDGNFSRINEDFEVGFVDMKRYSNLYYRSQGIFTDPICVAETWHDDSIIVVKTLTLTEGKLSRRPDQRYFIIKIEDYKKNPDQMKSKGVISIDVNQFNQLSKEKLSYNNWHVN